MILLVQQLGLHRWKREALELKWVASRKIQEEAAEELARYNRWHGCWRVFYKLIQAFWNQVEQC